MKSWFARFEISAALDRDPRPRGSPPPRIHGSDELRRFAGELAALDRDLKATAPKPGAPASLHRSIMRAVRAADHPREAARERVFLRWLIAPAAAVIALLVAWQAVRGPGQPSGPKPPPLAAAANALEMGGQLVQAVPSAVVAPLANELELLNQDLDNTARFLLASLP